LSEFKANAPTMSIEAIQPITSTKTSYIIINLIDEKK
jgi:hypothetical protein